MNAGEQNRLTAGVRVLTVRGYMAGKSGVVTANSGPDWRRVQWDDGGSAWCKSDDLIPETQALGNVRRLP